jgi:hypothetical protein
MTTIAEKLFAAANLANEQTATRAAASAERFAEKVMSLCEGVASSGQMYYKFSQMATSVEEALRLGVSTETDLFTLFKHPRCMAILRNNKFRVRQHGQLIFVSWDLNDPRDDLV